VYYLYILQSESTGRFYIGQTQDVPERLEYHTPTTHPEATRFFAFPRSAKVLNLKVLIPYPPV